jgi:predicted DsbA family dithiol-disulfide isomerase
MVDLAEEPHVIEVFADIWCPFAHVGLRAIRDQRASRGRPDVLIRVRAWPLELVNGAPLDPDLTRQHVDELREQVAPTMFRNLDLDRFPTSTLDALALVVRGYRTDPSLGERASFVLRDALFESGQDISNSIVLERIADEIGISMPDESDHAAVLTDWQEGRERGVKGSPHFFCGTIDAFCPSLDISKAPGHGLSIARDASRLTEFLEQCFAASDRPS